MNTCPIVARHLPARPDHSWKVVADAKLTPGLERNAPGRELVAYHDAQRRLVVAQWRGGTYHFDTAARRWACVVAPDSGRPSPDGHDAFTAFRGDSSSGQGLLLDFRTRELWSYDPGRAQWARLAPMGDSLPQGKRMLAYFDPALGVMTVLNDTEVWAHRPAGPR